MFAKLFEMFGTLCEVLDEASNCSSCSLRCSSCSTSCSGSCSACWSQLFPGPLYIFTVHFTMPTLLQLLSLSCAGLIYCVRILVTASANNLVAHVKRQLLLTDNHRRPCSSDLLQCQSELHGGLQALSTHFERIWTLQKVMSRVMTACDYLLIAASFAWLCVSM